MANKTLEEQLEASGLTVFGRCEKISAYGPDLLLHAPLLQDFTPAEADILGASMRLIRAEAGQVIIREGESGEWMMLVLKGTVDVTKRLDPEFDPQAAGGDKSPAPTGQPGERSPEDAGHNKSLEGDRWPDASKASEAAREHQEADGHDTQERGGSRPDPAGADGPNSSDNSRNIHNASNAGTADDAEPKKPLVSRIAVVQRGASIGEMSMLDSEPRYATCTAIETVEAAALGRQEIALLIRDHPAVGAKLLVKLTQLMSQRLRNTSNQLVKLLRAQQASK